MDGMKLYTHQDDVDAKDDAKDRQWLTRVMTGYGLSVTILAVGLFFGGIQTAAAWAYSSAGILAALGVGGLILARFLRHEYEKMPQMRKIEIPNDVWRFYARRRGNVNLSADSEYVLLAWATVAYNSIDVNTEGGHERMKLFFVVLPDIIERLSRRQQTLSRALIAGEAALNGSNVSGYNEAMDALGKL